MTTSNLGMTELVANQSQPHVPINTALRKLDATVQLVVLSFLNTPPGSPAQADRYVVDTAPTGAWVGHEDEIAFYDEGAWVYIAPQPGWTLFDQGTGARYTYGEGSPTGWDIWLGPIGPAGVAGAAGTNGATGATGPAGTTAGRHAVYVPAAAMTPSVSGGCAAHTTIAIAANRPDCQSLDFDATTQEYAQFSVRMPKLWNEGSVTFAPVWSHPSTATNFGVVWDLQAVALSNDDPLDSAYGTAQTSSDTGGTTNDLYVGPESSAITVGGTPAAEDMVFFRVSRVTGSGSDTMAVDARLHGLTIYMTTDAETDA